MAEDQGGQASPNAAEQPPPRARKKPPTATRPDDARRKALAAKAADYDIVRKTIEDASTFVRTLWITHVLFGVYLLLTAGSITHRQLFLETPITLPILNVQLPLVGFFVIAPAVFVIFHVYLLLQLRLLSDKADGFDALIRAASLDKAVEDGLRRQLPNDVLVQFLAGREDTRRFSAWMMPTATWITMAIGPLVVLLFIQLRFLPFQDQAVTWWQRGCVAVDLFALGLLWWTILAGEATSDAGRRKLIGWSWAIGAVALFLSWGVLTFPRETIDDAFAKRWIHSWAVWPLRPKQDPQQEKDVQNESALLRQFYWRESLALGERVWLNRTLETRRIVAGNLRLSGVTLIDLEALQKIEEYEQKRTPKSAAQESRRLVRIGPRNLVAADFGFADLRRADLRDVMLQDAFFGEARLNLAWLDRAQLQGASLDRAQLQGASLELAYLQSASLDFAKLQGASLDGAQLQGASLRAAQLQSAWLDFAKLQSASLDGAQLQGASLDHAQFQGASLNGAQLQGASLDGAGLQGASLNGAQLQGASLDGAGLQGTLLDFASLQGASLDVAWLQGASLYRAQLQGASLYLARLQGASVEDTLAYRAAFDNTEHQFLEGIPILEKIYRSNPYFDEPSTLEDIVIKSWIDAATAHVSDEKRKKTIIERFSRLAEQSPAAEDAPPSFRRVLLPEELKDYADFVLRLACDSAAPHVARGLVRNGRMAAAREEAAAVAEGIRKGRADPSACPGVAGFTDDDWRLLEMKLRRATPKEAPPPPAAPSL